MTPSQGSRQLCQRVPTQGRGSGAAEGLSPFPSPPAANTHSFSPLKAGFCIYHHSPPLQQEGKSPQPSPSSWFPFKGATGNHFLSHPVFPREHMEQIKLFQKGQTGFVLRLEEFSPAQAGIWPRSLALSQHQAGTGRMGGQGLGCKESTQVKARVHKFIYKNSNYNIIQELFTHRILELFTTRM